MHGVHGCLLDGCGMYSITSHVEGLNPGISNIPENLTDATVCCTYEYLL
jgi:hypothetical protein